jgi:hypothetical protein
MRKYLKDFQKFAQFLSQAFGRDFRGPLTSDVNLAMRPIQITTFVPVAPSPRGTQGYIQVAITSGASTFQGN